MARPIDFDYICKLSLDTIDETEYYFVGRNEYK